MKNIYFTHFFDKGVKHLSSVVAESPAEARRLIQRRGVGEVLEDGAPMPFVGECMPMNADQVLSQGRFMMRLTINMTFDPTIIVPATEALQILERMHEIYVSFEKDQTEAGHEMRDGAWSGMYHALVILRQGVEGVPEMSRSDCPRPSFEPEQEDEEEIDSEFDDHLN